MESKNALVFICHTLGCNYSTTWYPSSLLRSQPSIFCDHVNFITIFRSIMMFLSSNFVLSQCSIFYDYINCNFMQFLFLNCYYKLQYFFFNFFHIIKFNILTYFYTNSLLFWSNLLLDPCCDLHSIIVLR